jgi:hypothetical protein
LRGPLFHPFDCIDPKLFLIQIDTGSRKDTSTQEKQTRKFRKNDGALGKLSPEQYRVTQQNGIDASGTGAYLNNKEPGIHVDIVSGEPPFASSNNLSRDAADSASPSIGGTLISRSLHIGR